MQCKQCGKDIAGEEHRMVAEWPFCIDCFQQLMEKPAEKVKDEAAADTPPEAPAEPVAEPGKKDVSVEVVFEQEKQKCTLCGKETEGEQYKKVGIWTFCLRMPPGHDSPAQAPSPARTRGRTSR